MDLPVIDLSIIALYILGIVIFGGWFVTRNKSGNDFMIASSSLPGWAVGLSFFGTYLSSNTFIGVVGKSFGSDWNFFVFSLAIPLAAWVGVKYFVPFYRSRGEISAYHHMQQRFGPWARIYCVTCFLLIQIARIATITFGMSLALHGLTGWSMSMIIVVSGVVITLYTVMGGLKAVIWTDVVQSFVLMLGALILMVVILFTSNTEPVTLIQSAYHEGKFSLGSFELSLTASTFWVVFLYSLFMNLKAFGFDQINVQRYHAASSDREAKKSLLLGALLYIPISALFFFIGSILYSYYMEQPELLFDLKEKTAIAMVERDRIQDDSEAPSDQVEALKSSLTIPEIADNALPHFMSQRLPVGVAGLIIAAIMAAAMSTISTCLNSSATILLVDFYDRIRSSIPEKERMLFLRLATLVFGILGSCTALLMIGVESILAVWWQLTSIFAGAMLGLFLLGFLTQKVDSTAASIAVMIGVLVVAWIAVSNHLDLLPPFLQSPFHTYMSVVVGTISMFLVGVILSSRKAVPASNR